MKSLSSKPLSLLTLSLILILTLAMWALPSGAVAKVNAQPGQTLYTQFSLFHLEYIHATTNYRKGTLVPVNTAVKFVKSGGQYIIVTLPDGQDLNLKNVPDFSGENIDGIFSRTFATKPVDLSQFTEDEKKAIMEGKVVLGMRKSAVLVSLGYPPKHKTPDLKMNQWRYWDSRFGSFMIYFENDKVTRVQS